MVTIEFAECDVCGQPGELKVIDGQLMCVACESLYLYDRNNARREEEVATQE